MRVECLISILRCIEPVRNQSSVSEALCQFLGTHSSKQVKALASKLSAIESKSESTSQQLVEASRLVDTMAEVFRLGGARAASEELSKLARELNKSGWSLDELHESGAGLSKTKTSADAHSVVDQELVLRYVDLLVDTQSNNDAFDLAIKKLKGDKLPKLGDLRQIARRFAGYELSGKTKAEFIRKIVERQALDARHDAKSAALG